MNTDTPTSNTETPNQFPAPSVPANLGGQQATFSAASVPPTTFPAPSVPADTTFPTPSNSTPVNGEPSNNAPANGAPAQPLQLTNEHLIYASIFSSDEGVYRRRNDLINTISISAMFQNEFHVFYIVTKDHPRIIPNRDFIEVFLQSNRAVFQKSRYIDFSNFQFGDTDPYAQFVDSCVTLFTELERRTVNDMEYYRAMEMHKMEYINKQSIQILEESAIILTEGVQHGNRSASGYSDMRQHIKNKFLEIDNMMNKTDRRGVITYGYSDDSDEDNSGTLKLVTTFGIDPLDRAIGGIYEGDMVSLLAPAKGCKSRFATYVLHNCLVNHGQSIVMWSVENGYKGWEALIRARHFNWFYNRNVKDVEQKRIIDADMIRKGELDDEMREMELASWADLRFNTSYGRMATIDEDFDLDTFLEVTENAINEVGAKLICLDYLQLIQGGAKQLSKNERISTAYMKTLQFLKRKKVGGIFPAQLKQNVVGDIQKMNPEELINMELRDSAGESYEVIKTPDVNLALYGTVEGIRNGEMKILSIPSRNSAPFEPIDLFVDAGSCTFHGIEKEAG